jgi:hypothetical protein
VELVSVCGTAGAGADRVLGCLRLRSSTSRVASVALLVLLLFGKRTHVVVAWYR